MKLATEVEQLGQERVGEKCEPAANERGEGRRTKADLARAAFPESSQSVTGRLLTNNILLAVAHVVTKVCMIMTLVFTARYLGVLRFGQLAFAGTFVGYFAVLQDLGLNTLSIREVARDKSEARRYLQNVLLARLVLTVMTVGLLVVLAALLDKPRVVQLAIVIIALGGLPAIVSTSNEILFAAFERFKYKALLNIVSALVTASATITVLVAGYGVLGVVGVGFGALSITAAISWWIARTRFPLQGAGFDWGFVKRLVRRSLPFGLTTFFAGLYFRLGIMMLSFLQGEQVVGWYYASFRLMESLLFLPGVLTMTLYPVMSGLAQSSHEGLQRLYTSSLKIVLVGALAVAVGTTILAGPIIRLFYGQGYEQSILLLQILIWALVLACLNTLMIFVILAKNGEISVLKATIALVAVNFLGNLLLIPRYGAAGACLMTVACEAIGTAYYMSLLLRYRLRAAVGSYLPRIGASVVALGACAFVLRNEHVGICVAISAFAYAAALYLTRVFSEKELATIRSSIGGLVSIRARRQ